MAQDAQKGISEASYSGSYQTGDDVKLRVPYSFRGTPYGEEEMAAIKEALQGDTLTMGPIVDKFQAEFAEYSGVPHAFATSNCTTAMHIAAQLLNFKPGDEIITTPITFIATSEPLLKMGAKPVFADVDPRSLNIDPKSVAEKITPKTKSIWVVHYGGQMVDMDPIMELAKKHNLTVLEDCAHAPGAEYKGRKAGSIGTFGAFSFHSLKNMTTLGEGGMLTTTDDGYAKEISILRCMGLQNYKNQADYWLPYHYDVVTIRGEIGNNFRMNETQASVGRAQLRKLDSFNARRMEIGRKLNAGLAGLEGIDTTWEDPNCKHIYHLYSLFFNEEINGASKDDFIRVLYREEGVQPIMHYKPNYLFTIYQERDPDYYKQGLCPVAEKRFSQLLNLPIHPMLTDESVDIMIDAVKSAHKKVRDRAASARSGIR